MNLYPYFPFLCTINVKFGKRFANDTVEFASFMKIGSGKSYLSDGRKLNYVHVSTVKPYGI
jgi:hypothetical protein